VLLERSQNIDSYTLKSWHRGALKLLENMYDTIKREEKHRTGGLSRGVENYRPPEMRNGKQGVIFL